jgi:hypothetical protein
MNSEAAFEKRKEARVYLDELQPEIALPRFSVLAILCSTGHQINGSGDFSDDQLVEVDDGGKLFRVKHPGPAARPADKDKNSHAVGCGCLQDILVVVSQEGPLSVKAEQFLKSVPKKGIRP